MRRIKERKKREREGRKMVKGSLVPKEKTRGETSDILKIPRPV